MSRFRSFTTLVLLAIPSQALPLSGDEIEEECWYGDEPVVTHGPQPAQHVVSSPAPLAHIPNAPPASILAPYEHKPTLSSPHPSSSQVPHATLPVPAQSHTLTTVGTVSGILFTLLALSAAARYVIRRRLASADPFKDPPKPRRGFPAFLLRFNRSAPPKRRLSDESWVSPHLPSTTPSLNIAAPSLLPHDFELRHYAFPTPARKRKLVPVTTPVCTPSDTVFGSRLDLDPTKDSGRSIQYTPIRVPPVRVPSPAYISPFSPSPSLASDMSTLSPAPSTEPLALTRAYANGPPHPEGVRLSRLLSASFQGTRTRAIARAVPNIQGPNTSPARSTTAHLIQTARTYAHAYRPSNATSTSLYTPPTSNSSLRLAGARSRAAFYPDNGGSRSPSVASANSNEPVRVAPSYTEGSGANNVPYAPYSPWRRTRDTLSTVTTFDTICTVPHLLRAASDMQTSTSIVVSPFADPQRALHAGPMMPSTSMSSLGTVGSGTVWPGTNAQTSAGPSLGLKLRLSDASEHDHYRAREKERRVQREREREQERLQQAAENVCSPESSSETSVLTSPSHPSPILESSNSIHRNPSTAARAPVARGAHRRSQSLTPFRRGEKGVRRRVRGDEIVGSSNEQVESNAGVSMHERTKSEPECMQVKDERDDDDDDGDGDECHADELRLGHSRTDHKRRTRIAFTLRDSESVLREIGW